MKIVTNTSSAPEAIGPYSQAISVNNMVYTSGQIPLLPDTGCLIDDRIESQTHQVLKNLTAVLKASGCNLSDVVKTTVFITDMAMFPIVNTIYAEYFNEQAPARSCVEVSKLPKNSLIEIEAIAVRP